MGKREIDFDMIDAALDACKNDSLSQSDLVSELKQVHQRLTGMRSAKSKERKDKWTLLVYKLYVKHSMSLSRLAADLGCSPGHLSQIFKRSGYRARSCSARSPGYSAKRRFRVDAAVFDAITEEAAYWLGFLYADGRVLVKNGQRPEGLRVVLARRDKQHLVKLRSFLKSDSPIVPSLSQIGGSTYQQSALSVYSTELAKRLMELGIVPRRATGNSDLPRIPGALAVHFLRGLFDGDGYIKRDMRVDFALSGWAFGVCGNLKTIVYVEKYARSLGLRPNRRIKNGRSEVNWRFELTGPSAISMIKALYGVQGPSLDRKYVIAEALIRLKKEMTGQGLAIATIGGKSRYIGIQGIKIK